METRSTELKIRIRPTLKAALDRAARREGRSTSNLVERICEEWLTREAAEQREKPKRKG